MEFTPAEKDRLLNFLGYGRLAAPYWFLGMEEGTGGEKDGTKLIEQNVRIRARDFEPVMDLYTSHLLFNIDITQLQRFTPVWLWMAKLLRGLNGASDWQDVPKAKAYIRSQLGRKDGETFLTELLPLPSPSLGHWFYASLFTSQASYHRELIPVRQQRLRTLITQYQPRIVFAYGAKYRQYYRGIFGDDGWQPVDERESIVWKQANGTTFVILPFFGVGAISTAAVQQVIDRLLT
jgi:hypothetical protein